VLLVGGELHVDLSLPFEFENGAYLSKMRMILLPPTQAMKLLSGDQAWQTGTP